MGGNSSKTGWDDPDKYKSKGKSKNDWGLSSVQRKIEDTMYRRAMVQREVQLSVNLAKARDTFMWGTSCWTVLATGVGTGLALGKPVPKVALVPIVVGAAGLANLWDMAYGNKLTRVVKESEFIMESERGRLVPPKQAPFYKFYTEEELAKYGEVQAVGSYTPSWLPWSRK